MLTLPFIQISFWLFKVTLNLTCGIYSICQNCSQIDRFNLVNKCLYLWPLEIETLRFSNNLLHLVFIIIQWYKEFLKAYLLWTMAWEGVLPYISYIGMCGPKGCGFWAVLGFAEMAGSLKTRMNFTEGGMDSRNQVWKWVCIWEARDE